MQRLKIKPQNRGDWLALRCLDVTSTEASALFDMSPYDTAFSLWHRKRDGEIVEIADNERMRWGLRLQDAIANGIADDMGWVAEPMTEYMRIPEVRMGASFDWRMIDDKNRIGLFEIKNVDYLVFRDKWQMEEGMLVAPPHIEIQLQQQMHVADVEWGAIGVLVGGNAPRTLVRERDREVGDAIQERVVAFWKSIEANTPPEPTYPDDAEFLCKLYDKVQPGTVLDARNNKELETLVADYARIREIEALAQEDKKVVQSKILGMIGEAEKVMLNGFSISAGLVNPSVVKEYVRNGYRNFRLTKKKEVAHA
jgi:predicted phage-related endonuclease